jgi:hypothetical protein
MTSKKSDVLKDAEVIEGAEVVEEAKIEEPVIEEAVADEKDDNAKAIKDLTLYVASGFDFESAKKEKIVVPPLGGKQEKKAILALLTFVSGDEGMMAQLFNSGGDIKILDFIKILTSGGDGAWDCLVKIAGYLLGKEDEWVSEHLILPDMIQVVRPFFLTEGKALIQAFKG